MIQDLDLLVQSAVNEVMSTMLSLDMELDTPGTSLATGAGHVAAGVGFTGRTTGMVYLYATNNFAKKLTSGLLRMNTGEVARDEMVNDAMGELANMVVGHMKSRLSDRGMPCALTIPCIVRGANFTIEPVSSTERQVSSFRCQNGQLVVEVLVKSTSISSCSA